MIIIRIIATSPDLFVVLVKGVQDLLAENRDSAHPVEQSSP